MRTDLATQDLDLKFTAGDFELVDANDQHTEHILTASPGDFIQFPLIGVGVQKRINSAGGLSTLKSEIRRNLQSDGYRVKGIQFTDGGIQINAEKTK